MGDLTKEEMVEMGLLPPQKPKAEAVEQTNEEEKPNPNSNTVRTLTKEQMIEMGLLPSETEQRPQKPKKEFVENSSAESELFKQYANRSQLALSFINTMLEQGAHREMSPERIVKFAFFLADKVQEQTNTDYLNALSELNRY